MKDLTQAGIDALNAGHIELMIAVEMQIDDAVWIRVHSRTGEYTINGEVYSGVGELGKVSPVDKKGDAKPSGLSLELSGIDKSLVSEVMSYHYQGRPLTLFVVVLDTQDYTIIDTNTLFKGKIDTINIQLGDKGVLAIQAENKLVDWMRSDRSKWTQVDHDRTLEDGQVDPFFAFIDEVINKEIEFTAYRNWKLN